MGNEHALSEAVGRLVEVVARLRGPGGCPWDREQTRATLRPYVTEEAFEVVEALDTGDAAKIREELGDLLFQVVLHAQLSAERGEFDFREVAAGLAEKLVRRHPHVFGAETAKDAAAVEQRWEAIKRDERSARGAGDSASVLDGVPTALPALSRAQKVQDRAARVGFEWPDAAAALAKLDEERRELGEAIASRDAAAIERELGDLLFAAVSAGRAARVHAEDALRGTIRRFTMRCTDLESSAARAGRDLQALSGDELRRLWEAAKSREA
ncbi:MAG TPA: nucleoside triphosphate pyrophosphohydrolase [Planctomycetota bacterium]|nr:nucleoside triphosphate pyrophosphohydrolase [Planctomycetota bacterium]